MATLPSIVVIKAPFKSQLDNANNPHGSCNVTSLAMCLEYLGAKRQSKNGQFEDELWRYMFNQGLTPGAPDHLAQVAENYGCRDRFKTNATIAEVKQHLTTKNPCIFHGYFTRSGHIVVAVGYDDTRSKKGLKNGFIVHDPYGEWFKWGYDTSLPGAFLNYSYELIEETCIPDGQFWVHFLSK